MMSFEGWVGLEQGGFGRKEVWSNEGLGRKLVWCLRRFGVYRGLSRGLTDAVP